MFGGFVWDMQFKKRVPFGFRSRTIYPSSDFDHLFVDAESSDTGFCQNEMIKNDNENFNGGKQERNGRVKRFLVALLNKSLRKCGFVGEGYESRRNVTANWRVSKEKTVLDGDEDGKSLNSDQPVVSEAAAQKLEGCESNDGAESNPDNLLRLVGRSPLLCRPLIFLIKSVWIICTFSAAYVVTKGRGILIYGKHMIWEAVEDTASASQGFNEEERGDSLVEPEKGLDDGQDVHLELKPSKVCQSRTIVSVPSRSRTPDFELDSVHDETAIQKKSESFENESLKNSGPVSGRNVIGMLPQTGRNAAPELTIHSRLPLISIQRNESNDKMKTERSTLGSRTKTMKMGLPYVKRPFQVFKKMLRSKEEATDTDIFCFTAGKTSNETMIELGKILISSFMCEILKHDVGKLKCKVPIDESKYAHVSILFNTSKKTDNETRVIMRRSKNDPHSTSKKELAEFYHHVWIEFLYLEI